MSIVQTAVKKVFNTFFGIHTYDPRTDVVDSRDVGMVARYNKQCNPFDGWGFMILDAINKQQSATDAFKVTEEGFTYYEVRLFEDIQKFFHERTGLVVGRDMIAKIEQEASCHSDYYTQIALNCHKYEKQHVQVAA